MVTSIKHCQELCSTNENFNDFGWIFTFVYSGNKEVVVNLKKYNVYNEYQLCCLTDGFHWLNFFLSQEEEPEFLVDNYTIQQEEDIINVFFNTLDLHYKVEDKDSAIILGKLTNEKVVAIANYIDSKFKNRYRFF